MFRLADHSLCEGAMHGARALRSLRGITCSSLAEGTSPFASTREASPPCADSIGYLSDSADVMNKRS